MKTKPLQISLAIFCLFTSLAQSQTIETFESGNLDNWTVLVGNAALAGNPVLGGSNSLQLGGNPLGPEPNSMMTHKTFAGTHGRYQVYFYCDGPEAEFNFFFQYLGPEDYYQVTCKASGTNAPELRLSRSFGDNDETLASVNPGFGLGDWHELTIERRCDNEIIILIDGTERISVTDPGIAMPGTIGLGAYSEFSYADDLSFEAFSAEVSIVGDTLFCNDPIILEASDIFSEYLWSNGSNRISTETEEAAILTLEVIDFEGCVGRDSVQVLTFCPSFFYAPNIFTPNFDGQNDFFRIFPEKDIERFNLKVFNRFGGMVFETETVEDTWDGTFNGRSAPADMYLWIADMDGFALSGSLVLMR